MRLQIESMSLLGTSRHIDFTAGINAIVGGMSGGKTATVSCIRALLGSTVNVVPELEGRSVAGTLLIGERRFRIIRRLVTTSTAKVEIAEIGTQNAWRLPAAKIESGYDQTYRDWLLDMLQLPHVRVPSSPSDTASRMVPVSINDYLMYCILKQNEIDDSVFGTPDNHDKNIKRRYVFEILYGIFSPEAAGLRERLREVSAELNALTADTTTLERLLDNTAFASRAALEVAHQEASQQLRDVRAATRSASRGAISIAVTMREQIADTEVNLAAIDRDLHAERASGESLQRLHDQLIAQSRRLTRSLVAERLLSDYEFHTCPRCGSSVPDRGDLDTCRLCLQTPPSVPTPAELSAEQDRVIEQVAETRTLIERSVRRVDTLRDVRANLIARRVSLGAQLDQATASFIADHADDLRATAATEARLEERVKHLDDYLELHRNLGAQQERVAVLEQEQDDITGRIDAARHSDPEIGLRLQRLDETFESVLRAFDVPRFDRQPGSHIHRKTYLPIVDGRPFMKLQSQGVEVLVNVAHVLAHQIVALTEASTNLPNLLVIDGISSNVGREGVDLTRLKNMYLTLQRAVAEHPKELQIILTDNDPPPIDGIHVALRLSDTDRLVPLENSVDVE